MCGFFLDVLRLPLPFSSFSFALALPAIRRGGPLSFGAVLVLLVDLHLHPCVQGSPHLRDWAAAVRDHDAGLSTGQRLAKELGTELRQDVIHKWSMSVAVAEKT